MSGIASAQTTLRDRAYASFTHHLLARDLKPGQFVSQRELVAFTGLSLGAIREVIPRLEAEGLITTIPQRGLQIAPIDVNLIREAFQFRLFLEREAVRLYCATAPDIELHRLRLTHESMLAEAESGHAKADAEARAQAIDWGLHDTFINALGNEIIAKAYLVNALKIRLIHQERFRIDGQIAPVMRQHLCIIAALERRDAEGAVTAITDHIEQARRKALSF